MIEVVVDVFWMSRAGAGVSVLVNVQVTFSPSFRLMLIPKAPLFPVEPPFWLVVTHDRPVRSQPGTEVSVTVYVVKSVMSANTRVSESVPFASSSRLKVDGERPPVVVKAKSWGCVPPATFLMIVIEPGKMTAAAESDRSWLPPDPFKLIRRMWYGEPEMATAEFSLPQSPRVEMWPPQARTGVATSAVKVMAIWADLSPANPVPSA